MTPKEKAEELVHKYVDLTDGWVYGIKNWNYKKQCALIAVDEILDVDCFDMSEEHFDNHIEYWQEVKQEIEKL